MTTTLTWNGKELPKELRDLPPGRYVITGVDDVESLTLAEEEGIRVALDQVRRGDVVAHDEVVRQLEARLKG